MSDMKIIPRVKSPARDTADSDFWKGARGDRTGAVFTAEYLWNLAYQGRIYVASDADENDTITGGTSFAATTPTLLLDVPAGTTAVPLGLNLRQVGTVAGGTISIALAVETTKIRYSSGGTSETNIIATRTDKPVKERCTLYSTSGSAITAAAAGTAVALYHDVLAEDVAPVSADAARFTVDWAADSPWLLVGPAAFLVFTYAATTGPTWRWVVKWAELPSSDLT